MAIICTKHGITHQHDFRSTPFTLSLKSFYELMDNYRKDPQCTIEYINDNEILITNIHSSNDVGFAMKIYVGQIANALTAHRTTPKVVERNAKT